MSSFLTNSSAERTQRRCLQATSVQEPPTSVIDNASLSRDPSPQDCKFTFVMSYSFISFSNPVFSQFRTGVRRRSPARSPRRASRLVCDSRGGKPGRHEEQPDQQPRARRELWNDLELQWRLQGMRHAPPQTCARCGGDGRAECRACNATGMLTLGDTLICTLDGNCNCLLCNAGLVVCPNCKGTGKIAAWLAYDWPSPWCTMSS